MGVDDLGPALAFGLGLARHRPLHGLGDLDILDLHHAHLDTPRLRLGIDGLPQILVQVVTVRKQGVQLARPTTERSVVWAICEVAA